MYDNNNYIVMMKSILFNNELIFSTACSCLYIIYFVYIFCIISFCVKQVFYMGLVLYTPATALQAVTVSHSGVPSWQPPSSQQSILLWYVIAFSIMKV